MTITFFFPFLYPLDSIGHFLFLLCISFFGRDPLVSIWHFFLYWLSRYRTTCHSVLGGTRLLLFLRHISLRTFIFSLFTYFLAFFSYTNLIFSMSYLSLWLCPHYSPYMPTLYDAWYFSTYLTHFSFFFSQIKTKSFQISFSIISGLFFCFFSPTLVTPISGVT